MSIDTIPLLKFSDLHRVAFGTCQNFHNDLAKLGVKLPLLSSALEAGEVIDAAGNVVLVIDGSRRLPDNTAVQIAHWIAMAVNTCAGYRAEIQKT